MYYHGIKQDPKNEEADTDVRNIEGTSKITRSGRIFSPEIAPPRAVFGPSSANEVIPAPIKLSARIPLIEDVVVPSTVSPTAADKGKGIQDEPVRTRAQPLARREDASTSGNFTIPNNITDISISFFSLQILLNTMVIYISTIMPWDSLV